MFAARLSSVATPGASRTLHACMCVWLFVCTWSCFSFRPAVHSPGKPLNLCYRAAKAIIFPLKCTHRESVMHTRRTAASITKSKQGNSSNGQNIHTDKDTNTQTKEAAQQHRSKYIYLYRYGASQLGSITKFANSTTVQCAASNAVHYKMTYK